MYLLCIITALSLSLSIYIYIYIHICIHISLAVVILCYALSFFPSASTRPPARKHREGVSRRRAQWDMCIYIYIYTYVYSNHNNHHHNNDSNHNNTTTTTNDDNNEYYQFVPRSSRRTYLSEPHDLRSELRSPRFEIMRTRRKGSGSPPMFGGCLVDKL